MTHLTISPHHARRKLAVSYSGLYALLGRKRRYDLADIERILAARPKPSRRTRGPQVTVNPHGLTPKQAAQHLGISQPSLAWAANQGAIPRVKRGRGWTRYLPEHLDSPAVQEVAEVIRRNERAVIVAAQQREQAAMARKLEGATK